MSKKIIPLKHHLASGCCMWSGMEDVYATKTGQELPDAYLLGMSSLAESVLIKLHNGPAPYMLGLVDARPHKTYVNIKDLLGLQYKITNRSTPEAALKLAKKEIDAGLPVILGPLDMFYLPYLKMFQRFHVPIHYITMVGYDEEKDCIFIYDCDRIEMIELPINNLFSAWQVEKSHMGNKNGMVHFTMSDSLPNQYELAKIALSRKAKRQLCKKPSFVGINAFDRIARLLPEWESSLSKEEYRKLLAGLTQFFGNVPKVPNRILGIPDEDDIPYQANYERFGTMIIQLGKDLKKEDWLKAGELFLECGKMIQNIKERIVCFYCDDEPCMSEVPELFRRISSMSREAYQILL